jgi:acyl-coenzyme A synthetase/AMP-(fatty) acid ligase
MVSLDSNGNYLFWGRKDHLIKSRGYRIEIGEIETALMNHPKVKSGVVIPIPDDLIGNRIAAVVVPNNQAQLEKQEIIEHCHKHLAKYMIPEIIEFRSSLPTTWSGKTDRKTLLDELKGRSGL